MPTVKNEDIISNIWNQIMVQIYHMVFRGEDIT